jgi:hypothetical protein
MSQEKALEAFNNYNATAQTRRATERSTIQNNQHALTRAFTMFGSTTFLQLNKVSMAWKNMWDYMKEGKMPESKDMRALILNLGVANALFVLTSNIAKYALGDDEDRDEVLKEMKKALLGWNLLLTVPFFNEVFQELDNYINDTKKPVKMGTNPLMSVWWKTKQALKADDVYEAMVPLIELTIGAQVDPAIGLYNIFKGDFNDDDVYSALGISKSYRPSPNEYRTSLLEQGYTEAEADEMVVQNDYMKALDKAEKDKKKELDEMYEELEAGDITDSEFDKQYEEIEKEYEEQLNEIDEEYGMK